MSINIEGFSLEKGEYCKRVKGGCVGGWRLCVQETQSEIHNRPPVRGMKFAVKILHGKHGSAIFTNTRLEVLSTARNENDMEILTV